MNRSISFSLEIWKKSGLISFSPTSERDRKKAAKSVT